MFQFRSNLIVNELLSRIKIFYVKNLFHVLIDNMSHRINNYIKYKTGRDALVVFLAIES